MAGKIRCASQRRWRGEANLGGEGAPIVILKLEDGVGLRPQQQDRAAELLADFGHDEHEARVLAAGDRGRGGELLPGAGARIEGPSIIEHDAAREVRAATKQHK